MMENSITQRQTGKTVMPGPSSDIADFFADNGYYLARNVYTQANLAMMEDDFDRIVEGLESSGENVNARWDSEGTDELDGGASRIIHTHNVQRYSACWLSALQQVRFLDIVEQILGRDIILHHSKLFQKPPADGAPFPIHQDWWYFPTRKDTMIAAVIFLSDADDETGGFRLYPGSHRLGRQKNSSGLQPSKLLQRYPLEGAMPVSAKRGDVLFFSYFTLHGSMPNRSGRLRKTVLVQLYSGKDFVLPNDEVNHVNENLCRQKPFLLRDHLRMDETVKLPSRVGIGKNDGSQLFPIDRPIRCQDVAPEPLTDRFGKLRLPIHKLMHDRIGIHGEGSSFGQKFPDMGLPTCDAAGEADPQHR